MSIKIKNAAEDSAAYFIAGISDSALNLVGAEASGTCVNMAGSSVDHSLNALNVGLPGTVGTSVGVRNLDTKGYALTTKITLSHSLHLPSFHYSVIHALSQALRYDNKLSPKKQAFFSQIFCFFENLLIFFFAAGIMFPKASIQERCGTHDRYIQRPSCHPC
jgi:hypothetical protein